MDHAGASVDGIAPKADLDSEHGGSGGTISVAIMAGLACIPIVVAVGFLSDHVFAGSGSISVPSDISVLSLRGRFDAAAEKRPATPARAGY